MHAAPAHFRAGDFVHLADEPAARIRESALYRVAGASGAEMLRAASLAFDDLGPLVVGPAEDRAANEAMLDLDQALTLLAVLGTAQALAVAAALIAAGPLATAH